MAFLRLVLYLLAASSTLQLSHGASPDVKFQESGADTKYNSIARVVTRIFEALHYSREKLDTRMGKRVLELYLTRLDANKLFLLQQDVDEIFAKYGNTLHQSIRAGDLSPAYDIYHKFSTRVNERLTASNKELGHMSGEEFDTWSKGSKDIWAGKSEPKFSGFAKSDAESANRFRDRIRFALSQEETGKDTIIARQQEGIKRGFEMSRENIAIEFIGCIARAFDPHSEYMGGAALRNFSTVMSMGLVGIGVTLDQKDGQTFITDVVDGGPAKLSGNVFPKDYIIGVGDGEAAMEDIEGLPMEKVLVKLRGGKGTVVHLKLKCDKGERTVRLVRDEISIKQNQMLGEVIVHELDGRGALFGYIRVPQFYSSMNRDIEKSVADDVRKLLDDFKDKGIEGLIIDLREDTGGSLDEAVKMAGLFIESGPVVQVKSAKGKVNVLSDEDKGVHYGGPLVVLINRKSASASEIFAGAMQDYGRGLVIGDSKSYGKGTVQSLIELEKIFRNTKPQQTDTGAVKVTINKFYRINGKSTQRRGIAPDILLPARDTTPFGEDLDPSTLPYDEVPPLGIPIESLFDAKTVIDRAQARIDSYGAGFWEQRAGKTKYMETLPLKGPPELVAPDKSVVTDPVKLEAIKVLSDIECESYPTAMHFSPSSVN